MEAVSLFSGAGGMDYGFEQTGVRTVVGVERDADAAATRRQNLPGETLTGDIVDLAPSFERGMADIVHGGPPCQGYSVAGKMNPYDPRSALVHAFLDAVERISPKGFVMENVDALGRLEKWSGTLDDILGRAKALGFQVHLEILTATDFGVPQNRKRLFIWGSRNQTIDLKAVVSGALQTSRKLAPTCGEVLRKLPVHGTTGNERTCPAIITFCKKPVLRKSPYAGMLFNGAGRPLNLSGASHTIAASAGGNKTHIVDERSLRGGAENWAVEYRRHLNDKAPLTGATPQHLRRLSIAESAALQTFPEDFAFHGKKSSVYRQIGNAVPCLLAKAVAQASKASIQSEGETLRFAA